MIDPPCEFLEWDTRFFGRRIGRVVGHRLDAQRARDVVAWCEIHEVECLYFLADLDDWQTTQLAEDAGFHLVDVRVGFQHDVHPWHATSERAPSNAVDIRRFRESDVLGLQRIAGESHAASRFYHDPMFPTSACRRLYETWIERSCDGYADAVLVAAIDGHPVGYITCHLAGEPLAGRIGLVGVASHARGQGVGPMLVEHSLDWFAGQGVTAVQVATQGRNIAAQRLYQRCGFRTRSVRAWYHKWLTA